MPILDALIVGGGPAGTAAAIVLAGQGREVAVLERSDYSAARVGETLPPAANPLLRTLGVLDRMEADGQTRCPGVVCTWGDPLPYLSDSLFDPDGEGWHVDRARFDASLAARAAEAGARVVTRAEVRACRREGTTWEADVLGEGRLSARVLIDAAGRPPWPGRPTRRDAYDRQVALVRTFEADPGRPPDRRTWIEAVRDGWWYASALPRGRLLAAYFTDADLVRAPGRDWSARWDRLLALSPRHFEVASAKLRPRGRLGWSRPAARSPGGWRARVGSPWGMPRARSTRSRRRGSFTPSVREWRPPARCSASIPTPPWIDMWLGRRGRSLFRRP